MDFEQLKVASTHAVCKCCGARGAICGVVDFARSCMDTLSGTKIEPCAGVPIYFHRCEACGFVFTQAMDDWSHAGFAAHIYNRDYVRHDPDYLGKRPAENAEIIARHFPEMAQSALLDYGSGLGLLEKELKQRGFAAVDSFDPYASSSADSRKTLATAYPAIVSFEVFEHEPKPHELMSNLTALLAEEGAIFFSTQLIDDATMARGIENRWYCAPRNGHISFFTPRALAALARQHGLVAGSFNETQHFFYRGAMPAWIARYRHDIH